MKVYKYRSDIDRDIKTLLANQIFISSKDKLNDPCEALFNDDDLQNHIILADRVHIPHKSATQLYIEWINEVRESFGVYSMSFDVNNELLWSYYANEHKGFCIEYELELLRELPIPDSYANVIQMNYQDELPNLHFKFSDNIHEVVYIMHGYKSKRWKHEREIRIISDKLGLVDIKERAVTGIYFGLRMPESDKELIKNSLKGRDFKYYQMKLKPNSYLLEVELIK